MKTTLTVMTALILVTAITGYSCYLHFDVRVVAGAFMTIGALAGVPVGYFLKVKNGTPKS